MMLIINGIPYEIKMLGYIDDRQLLIEMSGTKEVIEKIFGRADSIVFINADGVKSDLSAVKFVGFLGGAAAGKELVVLK